MAGGEAQIEPRPTGPVSTRALVQRRSQREGGREERRCAEMMAAQSVSEYGTKIID